ncbi:hypothetical protein IJJ12_00130 [bacterium]|nr:hypothetical protein [bacterium]
MNQQERDENLVWQVFRQTLAEATGNQVEDVHQDSLIYDDLNLTEYDLQRLVRDVASKIDINAETIVEMIPDNPDIATVADVLDLIMDEKEFG